LPSRIAHTDVPAGPFAIGRDSEVKSYQFRELTGIFRAFEKATAVVILFALLTLEVKEISAHVVTPPVGLLSVGS
jgi:hypothetical protein